MNGEKLMEPRYWISHKWLKDPIFFNDPMYLLAERNDHQWFYVHRMGSLKRLTNDEMWEFLNSFLKPECICRTPQPKEDCPVENKFGKHRDMQRLQPGK